MADDQGQAAGASPSLSDRIKNNAVVVVIALGVAVASTTAGVVHYFESKQRELLLSRHEATVETLVSEKEQEIKALLVRHDEELDQVRTRLSSIERRLGGNDFFDVRQFFVDDARELELSETARFYGEAGFYAPSASERWHYTTMTEMEFLRHLMGESNPLFSLLTAMAPQMQNFGRMHLWRSGEEMTVEGPSPVSRVFPYVALERVEYADIFGEIDKVASEMAEILSTIPAADAAAIGEWAAGTTERAFRGDAVGAVLSSSLFFSVIMTNMFPNVSYYIKHLQKTDDVVYLQAVTTLRDVLVGGEPYANYFVTQEIIMISTRDALYVLQTSVPNDEPLPRSQYFVWVNEWLGDFAVVVK